VTSYYGLADNIIKRHAKEQGVKTIKWYPGKVQLNKSYHCGQFSQAVAVLVKKYLRDRPGAMPAEVTKLIDEFFDEQPTMANEKELFSLCGGPSRRPIEGFKESGK
jgi:hypothetical protein